MSPPPTRTDSGFKQNLDVTAVFSRASVEITGEGSGILGMNYTFRAKLSGQYANAENLRWYVNGVESRDAAGRTSITFIVDPILANQTYTVYATVSYNGSQVVSNTLTVSFEGGVSSGSSSSSSSSESSSSESASGSSSRQLFFGGGFRIFQLCRQFVRRFLGGRFAGSFGFVQQLGFPKPSQLWFFQQQAVLFRQLFGKLLQFFGQFLQCQQLLQQPSCFLGQFLCCGQLFQLPSEQFFQ